MFSSQNVLGRKWMNIEEKILTRSVIKNEGLNKGARNGNEISIRTKM